MASQASNHPLKHVCPHILSLLSKLHNQSAAQEAHLTWDDFEPGTVDEKMRDKFIAIEQDKAYFLYQMGLATGAKTIVETGTSYGVSTIYLALAVAANVEATGGPGKVIATEHEPAKARKAREHWNACGSSVHNLIELREGDVKATLKHELGTVDMLLLDIWGPLLLPVLKLVQPALRPGAVIITDNTISAAEHCKELLDYMRAPESGFRSLTLPFNNGLELSVYQPGNAQ
ncbi:O-methyltransferase [Aspergillus saccharolyticus JOP 1030-1]|uniref:S-adenosyl-L-methionine-dependent methyltransferase n=1 Tax=Aspergillus saccharolyticus JOP 1030-1 TaxID=1450539 RepID=A0A318ZN38_9EURO|nr:S-adenosyl-L-methionine-dependent methyltransferase [Aspergillus saccharolyticus JOP 1030-1]PYH41578.1 S-adenosyl-L-methionine-dependent methyltransferase [Aspergillus saccharolyticus JOP 1030-1]